MATEQDRAGGVRTERDALGERDLPAGALYGIQTLRALENFDLEGEKLWNRPAIIVYLAQVKVAAAQANRDLGLLSPSIAGAIVSAAQELIEGRFHDQFPLELVQGGGGTSTNMNMNEVLANRANEILGGRRGEYAPVHPHDHVNRSQSTNDVIPTASALAVHVTSRGAEAALDKLRDTLLLQARAHEGLRHLGRTCLQDALPVPVSEVHRAQAHTVAQARAELATACGRLLAVPLGGTAVGTGLGAPEGFRDVAISHLRAATGLDIRPADDLFAALASLEPLAAVADALARSGRTIARVAADLRLLASGPIGGIGEVTLPAVQPGSSMMPGKVNPVIPELVIQVSFQLEGVAHVAHLAAAAGELELAVTGPVVTAEILDGLERLSRVSVLFAERCIKDLTWQRERVEMNLRGSLQDAVESAGVIGYDAAARS
jgi:aspartate ammonia-lyase